MTVIPQEFDRKLAPLFGCAVTTATGVINNDAKMPSRTACIASGCLSHCTTR